MAFKADRTGVAVAELALRLGADLRAAPSVAETHVIDRVSGIRDADSSSIVFAEDEATLALALRSAAGAVLLSATLAETLLTGVEPVSAFLSLLVVAQPRLAFAQAAQLLRSEAGRPGIHPTAIVAPDARIGHRVAIGATAIIESGASIGERSEIGAGVVVGRGVVIGSGCRIHPRAVLYPGTRLGDRVVIHAGAVLGSDGFGYVRDKATGEYLQFPQQGTLAIEDDVEIGANSTIDRGALEETRIRRGAKLDNLVHVGHNVDVGEDVVIAAQTGISGSSTIGKGAVIGGQVGIGDHAGVGEGVILGGQAGVLPHKYLRGSGMLFWGTPAKPVQQYLREVAALGRLGRRRRPPATPAGPEEEGK